MYQHQPKISFILFYIYILISRHNMYPYTMLRIFGLFGCKSIITNQFYSKNIYKCKKIDFSIYITKYNKIKQNVIRENLRKGKKNPSIKPIFKTTKNLLNFACYFDTNIDQKIWRKTMNLSRSNMHSMKISLYFEGRLKNLKTATLARFSLRHFLFHSDVYPYFISMCIHIRFI